MPTSDYTPSTQDVARVIHGRARTRLGKEVGDFDSTTTVTADTVTGLIADAVDEIASAVGPDVPDGPDPDDPDTLRRMTKRVVTFLSAANIELSLEPEQAGQSGSAYERYYKRANDMRKTLIEAVSEAGGGGTGESVAGSDPLARGTFPDADGWDDVRF